MGKNENKEEIKEKIDLIKKRKNKEQEKGEWRERKKNGLKIHQGFMAHA
jgi:hypothetical protein